MSRTSVAKQRLVPISCLVMAVMLAFNASAAVFFSDFNSGIPAGTSIPPGPAGDANEAKVDGGFLKLTDAVNGTGGIYYIDDFGGGQTVQRFTATFKAAIFGSLCCGGGTLPADGFSFNLVPSATVVANPAYGVPAEEGLNEGLAVNFDTWDNGGEGPAIEVKWLGTVVGRVFTQPSQSPAGATTPEAASKDVFVNLDPDGKITVGYGGVLIFDHLQTPYDAAVVGNNPKWVFGARTGGANDNHWIDDLRIVTGVQSQVLFGSLGATWKYNQTESMDGVNWTAVDYNDSASPWFDGTSLLSSDSGNAIIAPMIGTPLVGPQTAQQGVAQHAYYFRKTFLWTQPVQPGAILTFSARVDDGIIIFLNGVEVERLRVPDDAPIQWAGQDLASALACGGDPDCGEDVFSVDGSALLPGANVLSAILYQEGGNSSDVTFGLGLAVTPPLAPTITDFSQPTNRVIFANRTTTLSVSYMASPAPSFQWFKDGAPVDPLINATATTSSLVISNMAATDAGDYYVVISNSVGTATSRTAVVGYDNDVTPPTIVRASVNPTFDRVTIEFDELLNPAGTDDPFNFTVNTGGGTPINPLSTVLNGRFLTLVMELPLLEDTVYTVEVSNLSDLAGNLIPGTLSANFRTLAQGRGALNFSVFDGLSTADNNIMTTLLADPRFPSSPSARYLLPAFDTRRIFPTDTKEGYGGQIVGLFIPPTSGNWIFYLRSDDSSRLYLNPAGSSVAGKTMIIEELACCQAFAALPSAPQALVAGERYYIEAIYKEGTGGDYCQVAAKLDTDPTDPNALSPIPSSMLGYYADPAGATVTLTQGPASTSVEENKSVTLTATGTGSTTASSLATFLWQRSDDGGSTWVDVFAQANTNGQSSFTIPVANLANDNGDQYRVVLSVPGASTTSAAATLTVTADTTPPSLISAVGSDSMKTITLRFDELILASSVDVFGFDAPGLTLNNAIATPDGFGVVLFLDSPMTEDTLYSVTANDVTDRASNPNTIGANRTVQFRSFAFGRGFLNFAVFNGSPGPLNAGLIGGNSVNDLVNHPTYIANTPSERLYLPAFDTRRAFPTDAHEAYGGKISGYFIPPTSGNWIFHLNADDGSVVRLNPTGTDPAGAVDLTFLDACCAAFATQFSAPQALTAGQRYYIEALYKEGGGGDYCRVAARLETDTTPIASLQPIPSIYLGALVNTVGAALNITQQPADQTFVVAPDVLYTENFTASGGGYTVANVGAPEGPWTYDSASGTWGAFNRAPCGSPEASTLTGPTIVVSKAGAVTVDLAHRYSYEYDGTRWDGGQLRVSINGAPFAAVPRTSFLQNGPGDPIQGNNLLTGQNAWNGDSAGYSAGTYITSRASLGTLAVGDTIALQFVSAWDECSEGQRPNWQLDRVQVNQGGASSLSAVFSVVATATVAGNTNPPVSYQWFRDNGAGFVPIPNATGASYSLVPVLADNGAKFRVEIFTLGASVVSDTATLTVVQPNTPPRFTAGPNQTVPEDSGPQSVPWASAISAHSIDRIPVVYASDFTTLPPGSAVTGSAVVGSDGILHLTDATNGVSGVFTTPSVPNRIDSFDISFNVLVGGGTCCGDRTADGWSMSFGDFALPVAYPVAHEEGTATGLVLSFDSWDNGGLDDSAVAPNIDVKVNSAIIAYQALEGVREGGRPPSGPVITDPATSAPMSYKTGTSFAPVRVHLDPDGTLDLDFKNVRIFNNVPTSIGQVINGRLAFAARTGGANDNHWIDDLNVVAYPVDSSSAEAGQTVQFLASNDNPSLFSAQPAISPTGVLTYTPAPNACGSAVVTVVAKDSGGTAFGGQDTSAPAQFTISVTCSNDCPTAVGQSVAVDQGSSVNIQLVGNDIDGDALSYVVTQPAVNGTVLVQIGTGAAVYTPNAGYAGPDSFRFRVEDGLCNSADALVTITVRPTVTNTPPVAKIVATPLDDFSPEIINKVLISCNGSNACLLLDGSTSFDLESPTSALTFSWTLAPNTIPFATGPTVVECLELGTQVITLTVKDPQGAEGRESLTIEVLSVGDALDELITKINDSTVARKNKRPFIATLKAAAASAERGDTQSTANQLNALKNKIRAQIARDNPADAAVWTSWTQSVIDALGRCDE